MHAGAQVEGLKAAHIVLDVGVQPLAHPVEGGLVVRDAGAQHQMLHVLQRPRDLLAAGYLAHAQIAGAVLQDDDIAGKVRRMRAGKVELHAVVTRDRVHVHFYDLRYHR